MKKNHPSRKNQKSLSYHGSYPSGKRYKSNALSRTTSLFEQTKLPESSSGTTRIEQPTPMEIPGYYYDSDKKRYFKIMPNRSIGNEHPFSEKSVREKLRKSRIDPLSRLDISSKISTLQYFKDREIFGWPTYSRCIRQSRNIMCKALRCTGVIEPCMLTSTPAMAITKMQIHPIRNEMYVGGNAGILSRIDFRASQANCSGVYRQLFATCGSEITSIRLMSDDILFTTIGTAQLPGTLFMCRELPDVENLHDDTFITHHIIFQFNTSKSTFWDCDTLGKQIVIGANREALYSSETLHFTHFPTESDIFTVHIDRAQPFTFYAGGRDGLVRLFDVRSSSKPTHGIGPAIRYQSSSITNIEKVGPYGLLVCAMDGHMDIWDLRAPRGEAPMEQKNDRERQLRKNSHPIVKFHGHNNEHNRHLGFAMNCDQTVVAIAGADSILRFFSVTDGGRPFHTITFPAQVTSLQFDGWEASENYLQQQQQQQNQQYPPKTIIKDREVVQRWEETYELKKAYKGEGLWVAVEGIINWMSV